MRPKREPDKPEGRDHEDGGGSLAFPSPSVRGLFGLSSDISYALLRWTKKSARVRSRVQDKTPMTRPVINHVRSYDQIKKLRCKARMDIGTKASWSKAVGTVQSLPSHTRSAHEGTAERKKMRMTARLSFKTHKKLGFYSVDK